jgi:hypothetical protein
LSRGTPAVMGFEGKGTLREEGRLPPAGTITD